MRAGSCPIGKERELTKYVVLLVGALLMFGGSASAQEEAAAEPKAAAEPAPAGAPSQADAPPQQEEKKKGVYYKRVQGWLWIEGVVGASAYDPDQFGSLEVGTAQDAPRLSGPEYGFSVFLGLGGFEIGVFYRRANYSQYKLSKVGLEIQGTLRFIPYVHPIFRVDIGYATTSGGSPYPTLTNTDSGGLALTGGFGLRIPIIRWMSFAATFDWSFVGLSLRGDDPSGTRFQSWILGQQFGATFALTFHFIGVRAD